LTEDINILIEGCIKFDRLSQEKLYQQFYPGLFALCHQFFDEEHDIITALNNGMLNAFSNIKKYDKKKGNLYGWVYCIVRNAALSHIRTRNSERKLFEITNEMEIGISINPFKDADAEMLLSFLTTLTTTTRAVFSLFYIEGFLVKEIAKALEMKEGTVKWHLNDGRSKLKLIYNNNTKIKGYAK